MFKEQDACTAGFAQTDSAIPWRVAETASMKKQVEEDFGWILLSTDANADTARQLADLDSFIAQQPDIILFPPREA